MPLEWETCRLKVLASLIAIRERAPDAWPEISRSISRQIDNLEPAHRLRAVAFLPNFPALWAQLQETTKTVLYETVSNILPGQITDFRILSAVRMHEFRYTMEQIIAALSGADLASALAIEPLIELWPTAWQLYGQSGSYRRSESNFRDLIMPFSGSMRSEHFDKLLAAVTANGQNWGAAETPELLARLLKNAATTDLPSRSARTEFCTYLRGHYSALDRYNDSIEILKADGWNPPQGKQAQEED